MYMVMCGGIPNAVSSIEDTIQEILFPLVKAKPVGMFSSCLTGGRITAVAERSSLARESAQSLDVQEEGS